MDINQVDSIAETIENKLFEESTDDIETNISKMHSLIIPIFKEIQSTFPSISSNVQYGIHSTDHKTGISEIITACDETISILLE